MSDEGFALYLRIILIVGGSIIFLCSVIGMYYTWKKLFLSQKLFGFGFLGYQLVILGTLRKALTEQWAFDWRIIVIIISELLIMAYIFIPLKLRRKSTDEMNKNLFSDKKN